MLAAGQREPGRRRRRRHRVGAEDLIVTETPRSGWAVETRRPDTVALDLELTHELRLPGWCATSCGFVQEARKNAGLEVTDRIELWWRVGGSPEPAEAIRAHVEQLAGEVLATDWSRARPTRASRSTRSATRSSACASGCAAPASGCRSGRPPAAARPARAPSVPPWQLAVASQPGRPRAGPSGRHPARTARARPGRSRRDHAAATRGSS